MLPPSPELDFRQLEAPAFLQRRTVARTWYQLQTPPIPLTSEVVHSAASPIKGQPWISVEDRRARQKNMRWP